jgi:DNA-binding PadR family transcriptional regulator
MVNMKPKSTDDLRARTIKNFADMLILKYIKKHPLSSGYEILRYLYTTYSIVFSPGTIYHEIYRLERKNLIQSQGDENVRMYTITSDGDGALTAAVNASKQMQELVAEILSEN